MSAVVTTIASFPTSAENGVDPDGQLFIDSNGDLIGATVHGGSEADPTNQVGTTYEITKVAGGFATTPTYLADIPADLNTLLGVPNLSADASGDLFGLELTGGANSLGAVIEFPAGGAPVTVASFTTAASNPGGRLLVDASGNLFGTTLSGGANGSGAVYEIKKTGSTYATTPTVLASFGSGITPSGLGNLVEDAAGDLFGTTIGGTGSSVFEVEKTGASYSSPVNLVPFPVGTQIGTLTIDSKGDIFGTTIGGGANDDGTVFEIEKTANGYASTPTTLASFTAADGQLSLNHPKSLIVDANGDIFGTTDPSSQNSGGVVYEIVRTPNGYESTPTIVHNFNGAADKGLGANLVADASGDLFGTTQKGGTSNDGTAFEITGSGYATSQTINPINPNLFWQSTSGQAAIWEMDGTTPINKAAAGPNPGPNWKEIGTGDFNHDGQSDILWQSTSGQAAIWEMDGTNLTSRAAVGANPGPNWRAIGTGDFNDDGRSDILWQDTVNGEVAIWEMNGTNVLSSAAVGSIPGPNWKAIGTGDFNGDGHSDILWQSTSGQVAIWEMGGPNGTDVTDVAAVGNPVPNWKAIGTGDFDHDGHSDILFQSTSGQVAIWEMGGPNGTTLSSRIAVGNAGASWHAIGTGAGGSDILFQNPSTSQIAIWEMNGTTLTNAGAAAVASIPGSTWRAVELT